MASGALSKTPPAGEESADERRDTIRWRLDISDRVTRLEVKVNIAAFLSAASFIVILGELVTRIH